LQLLITDDLETTTIIINILRELFAVQINVIHKLDEKTLNAILDEVIYKLTTSNLLEVGQYVDISHFFLPVQGFTIFFIIELQLIS
jgi:hypothetical protein